MTKKSWSDKLKQWRKDNEEHYAQTILSKPKKVSLYSILPFPGVVLIMGDRRMGKTGLAHEAAKQFHGRRGLPAVIHMPQVSENIRKKIQKLLPQWMKIVTRRTEWPKDCIVIYDEAAQSAHARRTQSGKAIELDDIIGISGQRNQLIFFISHHSRKLDINVVTEVNRIMWKKPTYAHQLFERDEVSDFSMRAYEFFKAINGKVSRKRATLILDFDEFGFYQCTNSLPPWWCDELSRLFQDVQRIGGGVL